MDAPRCIVCNTKHWSRQACPAMAGNTLSQHVDRRRLDHARDVLRDAEGVTKTPPVVKTETTPVKTEPVKTIDPVKTAVKTTGFDKKAWTKTYMRDYMRERRAAQKTVAASS